MRVRHDITHMIDLVEQTLSKCLFLHAISLYVVRLCYCYSRLLSTFPRCGPRTDMSNFMLMRMLNLIDAGVCISPFVHASKISVSG